jgi:hypothetical protein
MVMSAVRVTTVWLRDMRRLSHVVIGAAVVAGLAYTWRAAWYGEIASAAGGAAATLAVLGAGVLWGVGLRAGLAAVRGQRRLDRIERRLDHVADAQLESQQHVVRLAAQVDRCRRETEDGDRQLQARLEEVQSRLTQRHQGLLTRIETFSKLHDEQAERLERRVSALESAVQRATAPADREPIEDRDWAVEDTPPGERTVAAYTHLVDDGASGDGLEDARESALRRALRLEFASLIHRRDYVAALAKGDEILERFSGTQAAADFRRVRPHLIRRIELAERATRRSLT